MKLYLNETSPFARWVLICTIEYCLYDLQLIWVNPWENPDILQDVNPFSTVPTLVTDQGHVIYESYFIVQYLVNYLNQGNRSSLEIDLERLQRSALGKMLMETIFRQVSLCRYTPENEPFHPFVDRFHQTIERVVKSISQQDLPIFSTDRIPDFSSLQLAVALDYLAFRHPKLMASSMPEFLGQHLSHYQSRPSFIMTQPTELMIKPNNLKSVRSRFTAQ
jgi:glutathione S-transferase